MELAILSIGFLIFAAHLFSVLFEYAKIPDVLLLMLIGLVVGPVAGVLGPEDFGRFGKVLTTLALIVILFEGSLSLNIRALMGSLLSTLTVTMASFVCTVAAVSGICWVFTPLNLPASILTGVILGGTSSAVVIPMIRSLKLSDRPRDVLFMESVLTDVICIVGTLAIVRAMITGETSLADATVGIAASFGIGAMIGGIGGLAWSYFLHRVRKFPNTFFTTVAFVMILYGVSEGMGFSGAVAALIFGLTISVAPHLRLGGMSEHLAVRLEGFNKTEKLFFSELVFLFKTYFFIYLGLSIQLGRIGPVLVGLVLVPAIYFLRLGVTWFSLPRATSRRDASLVAVMVPKGLAAAVLASVPLQKGLPQADWIQAIVYAVILFSILACATLVFLIERTALGRVYGKILGRYAGTAPPAGI